MHTQAPLFQNDLALHFQIVSNTIRMHHLLSLFSYGFFAVPNRFECHQNAPFSVIVFKSVSADLNYFKYGQNGPFTIIIFLFFSVVPTRLKCLQNEHFTIPVFKIISAFPNCSKFLYYVYVWYTKFYKRWLDPVGKWPSSYPISYKLQPPLRLLLFPWARNYPQCPILVGSRNEFDHHSDPEIDQCYCHLFVLSKISLFD